MVLGVGAGAVEVDEQHPGVPSLSTEVEQIHDFGPRGRMATKDSRRVD